MLSFHSVSHAQYSSDGTKTTFVDILNSFDQFLNYTNFAVRTTDNSMENVQNVLEASRTIRLTVKYWTDLIEKLTNLDTIAIAVAAVTPVLFLIKKVSVASYNKIKPCFSCF
jgi:hypothetical protein